MAKKILVSYNFGGREIQNALVHVLASAPTALAAGQIYYDSTENQYLGDFYIQIKEKTYR